ncbi:MAG: homocysteine biosynthesis protein [Candidatus Euphemobacter frigidus]|nr:homocysteine biosynthesis protein [Candidatus Euphemobacter frigidus]MDP8275469.1 homocysteine biosynthesis protein [Candidatus Euphemobacter frigidus]
MSKTIAEINDKIKKGKAVVVTVEELIGLVEEKGVSKSAQTVDVVTTGTMGPMCSSGAYFNIGQPKPKIKLGGGKAYLNDIPVYTGLAAGDFFIGAGALPDSDPRNKIYPGKFAYGGGHAIEDLVAGQDLRFTATAYGTDCYPRKELSTWLSIRDMNEAVLFNPRNIYQNYNVAVNLSDRVIYTYMGILKPNLGNANYCSAGQLSPLLKDPGFLTIGIGTRVFLGGGVGYIAWWGTQHNTSVKTNRNGVPTAPAGTAALIGDLKQMSPEWLKGASFTGYGATMVVGVGVPIPILNEEICRHAALPDEKLSTRIVDYGRDYPQGRMRDLGTVNYAQLKSGTIRVRDKQVPTASLSSYPRAIKIASILKSWIEEGRFFLTERVGEFPGPGSGYSYHPLKERPIT